MAVHDFTAQRLFLATPLAAGQTIDLDRDRANYLLSVLRMRSGDEILIFNGADGEWRARLTVTGRKAASLEPVAQTRPQEKPSDLAYLFAPLKHARLDYMAQKAVEMGVGRLQPVLTERTQVWRVNEARLRANAIEATEQCGILAVPDIGSPLPLKAAVQALEPERLLVFCDEAAPAVDPVAALAAHRDRRPACALLVGPEGGFTPVERSALLDRPGIVRLSLGPRILRADTAAVAALAVLQAILGDWR